MGSTVVPSTAVTLRPSLGYALERLVQLGREKMQTAAQAAHTATQWAYAAGAKANHHVQAYLATQTPQARMARERAGMQASFASQVAAWRRREENYFTDGHYLEFSLTTAKPQPRPLVSVAQAAKALSYTAETRNVVADGLLAQLRYTHPLSRRGADVTWHEHYDRNFKELMGLYTATYPKDGDERYVFSRPELAASLGMSAQQMRVALRQHGITRPKRALLRKDWELAPGILLSGPVPAEHTCATQKRHIDDYVATHYATKAAAQTKRVYLEEFKGLQGRELALALYYLDSSQHGRPAQATDRFSRGEVKVPLYKTKWLFTQKEIREITGLTTKELRTLTEEHAYSRAQHSKRLKEEQIAYIRRLQAFDAKRVSEQLGIGKATAIRYRGLDSVALAA